MIYPSAVVLLAIAAVAVIMVVVIPQFQQIFIGLLGPGEQLPLPTRIVVGISDFRRLGRIGYPGLRYRHCSGNSLLLQNNKRKKDYR